MALLLTACGHSKPSVNPADGYLIGGVGVVIDPLPPAIATCPDAALIPWDRVDGQGILPLDEVMRAWGTDRMNGAICRRNLGVASSRYEDLRMTLSEPGDDPSLVE